jgi:hypothetical protein
MPAGKVNSGNFRNGTPVTLPLTFGTPVDGTSKNYGNVQPQSNSTLNSNPVTWLPAASHFGNQVSLSMQAVLPILLVEAGGTGSFTIPITDLQGFSGSVTLSFSGAPSGVTISFAPNPATTTSTGEVSVGASVPTGKYTITITGTSGTVVTHTNLHLVVVGNSLPSNAFGFELEDGTGVILLENGSILLLENQS